MAVSRLEVEVIMPEPSWKGSSRSASFFPILLAITVSTTGNKAFPLIIARLMPQAKK
jgi:hypothetical protein